VSSLSLGGAEFIMSVLILEMDSFPFLGRQRPGRSIVITENHFPETRINIYRFGTTSMPFHSILDAMVMPSPASR